MQDNQSREAGSTGLHLCGLYYNFEQPKSTTSRIFAFLGSLLWPNFFQVRIRTLRDTQLVASRYNKEENTSLLVDVHCSNTSLLKPGLLIFRGKKSKILRGFQGQIRGKIDRFRGILAGEKSKLAEKLADFAGF